MINYFRKAANEDDSGAAAGRLADTGAIQAALDKAVQDRPYLHQQVTGRELHANILEALAHEPPEGKVETALAVMGSLAGFSVLYAIHRKYERGRISPDAEGFRIDVTEDGRRLFFGTLIEDALLHGKRSLWLMIKTKAQTLGALTLPDVEEIVAHVAASGPSPAFGVPRVTETHMPRDLPSNFVRYLMPAYLPLLRQYDSNADLFQLSFSYAICALMEENCEVIAPSVAADLVMECAIPMAALDPAEVF